MNSRRPGRHNPRHENQHGDLSLADAILDRLLHNAYKLELRGESMPKTRNALTEPTT